MAYVTRSAEGQPHFSTKLRRGIKLAFLSILGILLIYSVAGILIVIASQILKAYMKWVTIGMGGILIILGGLMLAGKNLAFSVDINQNKHSSSEAWEAFVFGIAYAIGALGCLFPLFLIVATQAMAAKSLLLGGPAIFSLISLV